MVGTVVVSAVFLTVALVVIWRVDVYANRCLELQRARWNADCEAAQQERDAEAREQEVALLERKNAAKLAALVADEQAEADKAALLLQAAQDRAAAQVADATVADRIEGEKLALAAYNDGRAEGMRERGRADGLEGSICPGSDTGEFAELMQRYSEWREDSDKYSNTTLGQWLAGSGLTYENGRVTIQ